MRRQVNVVEQRMGNYSEPYRFAGGSETLAHPKLDFEHYAAKQSACVMRLMRLGWISGMSGSGVYCR